MQIRNRVGKLAVSGLLVLAFTAGFILRGGTVPGGGEQSQITNPKSQIDIWTCSMHPQIRLPKFGLCPICNMDLIPVEEDSTADADQPRQVTLSPAARKLAEVAVSPVERRSVAVEIRMVGKVDFDQTRLAYIAPRVSGRIDRLYANFVGMPVKPGDPLADMYSPELVSAQQELFQAMKATGGAAASEALLNATRERLRLWGLTTGQIAEIERSGQVRDHVTFTSPIGGIVVEKEAREGLYAEAGMRIFTVADLTQVWVQLDAYESNLAWLSYAQEVVFRVEAYPGRTFKGTIAFIDPLLDPMTRTVKVRVNVANADGQLKPEMFVRAVVQATVAGGGKVLQSALGVAAADEATAILPLVIPASAPLVTGKRAVVYVALPDKEGTYEGREVVLGPRAGDYFLVMEGLQEGEQVVVNGNFKIDSSLQIQGKPSMMTPDAESAPAGRPAAIPLIIAVPDTFRKQLDGILGNVLATGDALANGDLESARTGAANARQSLAGVDMSVLTGEGHARWMQSLNALNQSADKMLAAKDIEAFRLDFATLSTEMVRVLKTFGPVRSEPVYDLRCPMAFDNRGANWLQKDPAVRNPYFGKAMLACGEIVETIPSAVSAPAVGGHTHE
jgi:Cu(I)/Ag(I) efflux system membrane fusion protein